MVKKKHLNTEYERWRRKYPQFPGVDECVRLIETGKAKGEWADIIADELAANAQPCLSTLIDVFRNNRDKSAALYVMMALDIARIPDSVPFLIEVLHDNDPRFNPYAIRVLKAINTHECRQALWNAKDGAQWA